MALWLPPKVQDALVDERNAADTEADRLVEHDIRTAQRFTRELQTIDPYLELVWIGKPPSWDAAIDPPPGIVWHRWHVRRNNPDAPDSYWAHTTPNGGYREPDSGIFQELAENDAWSRGWNERQRRRQARAAAEKARGKEHERAEIREELRDRIKAKLNPGVSMTGQGSGWSYRAGARKR